MKKLTLILLLVSLFSFQASAVKIYMYGKSGAILKGDKIKLCPGFQFNVCAVVDVKLEDIIDFFESSNPVPIKGIVTETENNESYPVHIMFNSNIFDVDNNTGSVDCYDDNEISIYAK